MIELIATRALALVLSTCAIASAGDRQSVRPNDPSTDPFTQGDPALMEPAGIVSLGGFEFGPTDTAEVDAYLAVNDIKWIETQHIQLGFALGPYKVPQDARKAITAELTALAEKLPAIDPRTKVLGPWLRAHMYAARAEAAYAQFLAIVQVEDSAFPQGGRRSDPKNYFGEGPYLGQKGKYEILILPNEASSVSYLKNYFGIGIKRTQRWNVIDRDSLILVMHSQQGNLRDDRAMHGHMVFNLAHNFYDGFKHYSYDTPIWLHEGLAHYMERQVNPKFNSFDGSEGSLPEMTRKWKWEPLVKKLVASRDTPRLAELLRYKDYGEMELDDHFATWSMIDFLAREHPDELAGLLGGLKGLRNEAGISDGGNLLNIHRDLFRELLGMSYMQFDQAWQEWVAANY